MKLPDWKSWIVPGIVVTGGVLLVARCDGAAAAGAPAAPISAPISEARVPGAPAFWWTHMGDQSCAALWLGPPGLNDVGLPVRRWTVVISLPGSEEPLSCLQGTSPLAGNARIYLQGAFFLLDVRPVAGLTWGDVAGEEQLEIDRDGFY